MKTCDCTITKHPRVKNPKQLRQLRKETDCCERCGSHFNLEVAHVISRGAGGPDIRENCLVLCGPAALGAGCHGADHRGEISNIELFELISRRDGLTAEYCLIETRKAMGYNVKDYSTR